MASVTVYPSSASTTVGLIPPFQGTAVWDDMSKTLLLDGVSAHASRSSLPASARNILWKFSPNVPNDATVNGIEWKITANVNDHGAGATNGIQTAGYYDPNDGFSVEGYFNVTDYGVSSSGTLATYTFGGPTETYDQEGFATDGTTLKVNWPYFGILFSPYSILGSASTRDFYVDSCSLTIYYTPATQPLSYPQSTFLSDDRSTPIATKDRTETITVKDRTYIFKREPS